MSASFVITRPPACAPQVELADEPLRGEISGGDRTVGLSSALVIKAVDSYDPDLEDLTGEDAGLSFRWGCTLLSGSGHCNASELAQPEVADGGGGRAPGAAAEHV